MKQMYEFKFRFFADLTDHRSVFVSVNQRYLRAEFIYLPKAKI